MGIIHVIFLAYFYLAVITAKPTPVFAIYMNLV